MKLVTFHGLSGLYVGALDNDAIVDLTAAGVAGAMLELVEKGEAGLAADRQAVAAGRHRVPAEGVRLAAPIPRPPKILCSGINYKSHADENPNARMPEELFF